MDWLCLQSLAYLCLGRGSYELESNISTLYGDSIISDTDNIPFYRDSIRWNRDTAAWRDGDWVLSQRLLLCCSCCGALTMTTTAQGYISLKFCHLPSRREEGNERVGGPKPDNDTILQRLFRSLGAEDDKEMNPHAAKVKVYQRSFRFSVLLEVLLSGVVEIN